MSSLSGNLEDLGLGDILQYVSLSRKSGLINLGWGEVKGKIMFRKGMVVAAASSEGKRSLGSILAEQGVIPGSRKAMVDHAIDSLPDAARVKEALAKDLKIPADATEEAIREQIESTIFHFFTWPEGTFNFDLQDIEQELASLTPPDHAFVLDMGLSPQFLAMEGTRLQDERKRANAEPPVGPPVSGGKRGRAEEESGEIRKATRDVRGPEFPGAAAVNSPRPPSPPEREEDFGSVSEALAFYEKKSRPGTAVPAPAPARETKPESGPPPEPERPLASVREEFSPTLKPIEVSPPAREPIPPPKTSLAEEEPAMVAPQIVLLDDDPFVLSSLVHHLGAKGYRMKTFTRVEMALSYLQELVDQGSRPMVVLCDLIMPDSLRTTTLGGLEVLEKTRKVNPAISVYLMSDYENQQARARAEEMGARFFFTKPKASQLDEDYNSPELFNFVQVLESALMTEPRLEAASAEAPPPAEEKLINLGEELRREFGEELIPAEAEGESPPTRGLHMLKAMISELNDPSSSGQITLLVLRFAAEFMNRGVIFLVARNQIAGLGQFGLLLDGTDPQKHVRQIRIPLNESSIFREAIQKRMVLKKPLKQNKWNDYLVQSLGGEMPAEVFVAPIIAGGKIAAILYGDNIPDKKAIGDTESLEIFLAQVGLAMEKALLERRLKELGNPAESPGPERGDRV